MNKIVIAEVNIYFRNALTSSADHQLLSQSQLESINCWIPNPTGSQSFAFQKISITGDMNNTVILNITGNSPGGLCIYPLGKALTVGDHLRDQLIWVTE